MKRSRKWIWLAALLSVACLFGCREREQETETTTQAETAAPTEKVTERQTEKATEKQTEKESETEKKTTAKKTTVKPSTTGNTTNTTNTTNKTNTTNTANTANTAAGGATKQCPYCYQQISTAPDGNGSTIYDAHVAQEKNWADLYGYGDTPPVSQQTEAEASTEASQQAGTDDSKQCGYCYQWFSVSDGSYAAHLQAENQALGLPDGTEYKVCPKCGNSYPAGSLYDNHVCVDG